MHTERRVLSNGVINVACVRLANNGVLPEGEREREGEGERERERERE